MARPVNSLLKTCTVGAALWSALLSSTALAVGPQAPFAPPLTAVASMQAPVPDSAASDAEPPPAGLVGLRLGDAPAALIDGAWVRVGQVARGARLIEVRQGAVRLQHANGQIETLALFADPTAAALQPRRAVPFTPAAPRELP